MHLIDYFTAEIGSLRMISDGIRGDVIVDDSNSEFKFLIVLFIILLFPRLLLFLINNDSIIKKSDICSIFCIK